jgi:hypothetical protein
VQLAGPVTQDASKLIPDLKFRIGQYKDHMPNVPAGSLSWT